MRRVCISGSDDGGHDDGEAWHDGQRVRLCIPYRGSRVELMEIIAMARDGRIHAEATEFPLDQAVEAS